MPHYVVATKVLPGDQQVSVLVVGHRAVQIQLDLRVVELRGDAPQVLVVLARGHPLRLKKKEGNAKARSIAIAIARHQRSGALWAPLAAIGGRWWGFLRKTQKGLEQDDS
jgi:hypothetical protein